MRSACFGVQMALPTRLTQSVQEPIMAVQQNKKSPSKRGMHRSHNALNVPGTAVEPTTGEVTCVTTSAQPAFTVAVKC